MFDDCLDLSRNDSSVNATKFYNSEISFKEKPKFQESMISGCIPKNVYVSSKERNRKLEYLRNKLRANAFDHTNYDP
jgi:hypothetical protein